MLISPIHVFSFTSADLMEFSHLPTPGLGSCSISPDRRRTQHHKTPGQLLQLCFESLQTMMKPQGISCTVCGHFQEIPTPDFTSAAPLAPSERRLSVCAKSATSFRQTEQDLSRAKPPRIDVARKGRFARMNMKRNSNIRMKGSRKVIWCVKAEFLLSITNKSCLQPTVTPSPAHALYFSIIHHLGYWMFLISSSLFLKRNPCHK